MTRRKADPEIGLRHPKPRSRTNILYCLVLPTNGRRPWLTAFMMEQVAYHAGYLIERNGGVIEQVAGGGDHIEFLVSLKSKTSISDTVRLLKTQLTRFVKEEYLQHIRKYYDDPVISIWASTFLASTIGVRDELMIQEFLSEQDDALKNVSRRRGQKDISFRNV